MGVDSATLVALRELTTTPLWLATTAAFTVSLAVNFSLNMRWVFAAQGRLGGRLARYGGLVVVNYLLTLALVLGLAAAGVHYLIARWLAIAAAAVVNYVAYRHWVFR